jgi:ferritin-like metal-binding protein YciE
MQISNFEDMCVAELQELLSMEGQLAEALGRMAEVASYPSLKNALLHHRDGMQVQRQRLESILQKHGANAWAHTDQAMQTLVIETAKMASMLNNHELRDAGPHRIGPLEHYKIAAHGTAAALAGQLGLRVEQRMLHESLEEENKADALLRMLAKGEVNQDAVAVAPI